MLTYGLHFKHFSVFLLRFSESIYLHAMTLPRYLGMPLKSRDSAPLFIYLDTKPQTFVRHSSTVTPYSSLCNPCLWL